MNYDQLRMLVRYVSALGKSVSCITNCFWATDITVTLERLSLLKQDDLSLISESSDLLHHEKSKCSM